MAIHFSENVMGKIVITQNGNEFELDIRQGNCLGVVIHCRKEDDGYIHTLMDFFADEQHLKNRCKAVIRHSEDVILKEGATYSLKGFLARCETKLDLNQS